MIRSDPSRTNNPATEQGADPTSEVKRQPRPPLAAGVKRHSRRASSLFRSFSQRWSVSSISALTGGNKATKPSSQPTTSSSTPGSSPRQLPLEEEDDDDAESDSTSAQGSHAPQPERTQGTGRQRKFSKKQQPYPATTPEPPIEPPQPYFVVRPRSPRGSNSIHPNGKSPALPSPGSEYGGSGSSGIAATPPDHPDVSSAGWFSPGGTPSISTRELAASKGRLSIPSIQTHNLADLMGAGSSSSGSLRPSTPSAVTGATAHRASAWSAPPSIFGSNGTNRPTSFLSASASSAAGFDNTHLRLGDHLSLMSHGQTLQLYRANARKATDPQTVYELAVFMVEAAQVRDDVTLNDPKQRSSLFRESFGLLRKIADRGHVGAQYYLAECMAAGVGSEQSKKPSMTQAHAQYILAAKHGHSDAAYKAGRCYEKGWGCLKDNAKAVQWLRKAGAQGHAGALYRLGTAELNGELGRKKNAKEGIKYLKLSAQVATRE